MAKHKHYDCIVAWAEGKKIQYYDDDIHDWDDIDDPLWLEDTEYRIKPEPKPDIVRYAKAKFDYKREDGDNLKLTFNGETGKLKSVEVLDV